jgi:hypothetical protein
VILPSVTPIVIFIIYHIVPTPGLVGNLDFLDEIRLKTGALEK